jgi:hypothetical protein
MISAWWLFLIIPLSFVGGFMLCGVMSQGARIEECEQCRLQMRKEKSN